MPIRVPDNLRRISQEEFGRISYQVMEVVFEIHNKLGRFLQEALYQKAIAQRLPNAQLEAGIEVSFAGFSKHYSVDLLVDSTAPFELKGVEVLTRRHRAQLINYLLLLELSHGNLINLRPGTVEHEFVNAVRTRQQRTAFEVVAKDWDPLASPDLMPWLVAALRDWGTGLEVLLYQQAATHFFGGAEAVIGSTVISVDGRPLGIQPVRLASPGIAFKVTALSSDGCSAFCDHARRFLAHSSLEAIQWINIGRDEVMFQTLHRRECD